MPESPSESSQDLIRSHLQNLQREFAGRLPARLDELRSRHGRLGASGWNLHASGFGIGLICESIR